MAPTTSSTSPYRAWSREIRRSCDGAARGRAHHSQPARREGATKLLDEASPGSSVEDINWSERPQTTTNSRLGDGRDPSSQPPGWRRGPPIGMHPLGRVARPSRGGPPIFFARGRCERLGFSPLGPDVRQASGSRDTAADAGRPSVARRPVPSSHEPQRAEVLARVLFL